MAQGFILAAGYGSRLFPLTRFRSKPALPFLGRPLIQYSLELLDRAGIERIAINLHHRPDSVRRAVGERKVLYSEETAILGTSGALYPIRDWIDDDTLLICNGKIYFEGDLKRILEFHRAEKALVTLLLLPWRGGEGFNPVFLDPERNVTGFGQEGPGPSPQFPHVFSGIHVWDRSVLDELGPGPSDSVRDLYPKLIEAKRTLKGFLSTDFWCESSLPERYLRNSFQVLKRRGSSVVGVQAAPGRRAIAGDELQLGKDVALRECILWDRVTVGSGSTLSEVIATDDVRIPAGARLERVLITPAFDTAGLERQPSRLGENLLWPLENR